jgi:DNA repair exonuclease SbcCD ATPase subunit
MPLANYRIAELSIEGFRGFTTPQTLSFEGRNVFVFGPNGYGKSSIVEAIDWCLRGGGSDIAFRNIFYEKQECRVSLRLTGVNGDITIERELRPGQTESDRRIKDDRGKPVQLSDVLPQLSKLRSQYQSTQVIFSAQHGVGRRVPVDITEFGNVLYFYLHLEDVPDLIRRVSKLIEERRKEAETFAKKIEEVEQSYREEVASLQAKLESIFANPPWGEGPSPTPTETKRNLSSFVQEIGRLLGHTFPTDSSPAELLQKAEERINVLTERDTKVMQERLDVTAQRIERIESLVSQAQEASKQISQIEGKQRELRSRLKGISEGETREMLKNKIGVLGAEQTKESAALAIIERAASFCEEHKVDSCPACGSRFAGNTLLERVKSRLQKKAAADVGDQLENAKIKLAELDKAIAEQLANNSELSATRRRLTAGLTELATLLGEDQAEVKLTEIESRLVPLRLDLEALRRTQSDQRDERQKLTSRIKGYKLELSLHDHRDEMESLEQKLDLGMEPAHKKLRDYENFLYQVDELRRLVVDEFKNALDRAIPPLNDLLTEVYQRLTHHPSFQLVRVRQDQEKVGYLELRVAGQNRPDKDQPVNLLNGQARKAIHLVPYFVFSRFQSAILELDLLLIDDPSESFDTSHVELLVEELGIASGHAQLIVASHESEKFLPHLRNSFEKDSYVIMTVHDFDAERGPKIERQ